MPGVPGARTVNAGACKLTLLAKVSAKSSNHQKKFGLQRFPLVTAFLINVVALQK